MRVRFGKAIFFAALIFAVCTAALYFGARMTLRNPKQGGDFTLEGIAGPVSLHDFRGKGVILYFGYTGCPDACPLAFGRLSAAMRELPEALRKKLVPIFVSVDYRSDTAWKADTYVKYFLPEGVGLSGQKAQLDAAVSLYGSSYQILEDKKSALGYTVEHGTLFYFIDGRGNYISALSTMDSKEQLKEALESIL